MDRFAIRAVGAAFVLFASILHAQVPQLINYQGRVVVGTTNFDGIGSFKFALVNAAGTTAYWTNDGTHLDGTEPTVPVSLTVAKGLYSVLLGDTLLPNMTAIPASVFNNSDVRLRVWFNDGTHASQLLSPDQRIAAVGYAMLSGNVSDGAITSAKIASGAVGSAQLAAGAAAANLGSSGQSGVGSGGVILSPTDNNAALIAAGYVKIGATQTGDNWLGRSNVNAPSVRAGASAVWTGTEMIVWGGNGSTDFQIGPAGSTGGRYNPSTNSWTSTSTTNAPGARYNHTAVWTGTEMIVWGGISESNGNTLANGARYNPSTNTWQSMAAFPLSARTDYTAIWTGSVMIIWGGQDASALTNNGSRYDPVADSWANTAAAGIPARSKHTAVWTGSRMVIFGGNTGTGDARDGSRYNPTTNAWSATALPITTFERSEHIAVWTGSLMIVWGLDRSKMAPIPSGRYDPTANSWTYPPDAPIPDFRRGESAVWTGSEMIVWGGLTDGATTGGANDGARYNPASDSWTQTGNSGVPQARNGQAAVWDGNEMLIFGGTDGSVATGGRFNDTTAYYPGKVLYLYQKP